MHTSTIHAYINGAAHPSYIIIWKVQYPLCFVVSYSIFNLLHSSTNQELFEKHLCYQNSHYDKYTRFPLRREAIMCYPQIDIFHCQQRWMGHKGGHR